MKVIQVSDIKPGGKLARPVVSDKGVVLLYEGTKLTEESIRKLVANKINTVYLMEEETEVGAFTIESIQEDAVNAVQDIVSKKLQKVDDREGQYLTGIATKLIDDVVKDPRMSEQLINIKRFRNDIYSHSMSVAAMSVIIGLKAGLNMVQLQDIAVGAMLHDVGLPQVGIEYIDREITRLPAEEKLKYRSHVITGYERIQKEPWVSDIAKQIILSHHERMDGTGYPFHKIGERIPVEVRLVSICDYFDELANGIGYEKRKVYEVIETLRTLGTTLFDYNLLMQVMVNVAWYPSGSLVRTNEGELGRVIRQNSGLPDRPVLQIVKNADGSEPSGEITKDLLDCLTIFIEETIEE